MPDVRGASPLLILHGGWGLGFYPFDNPIAALAPDFRCVVPVRAGYDRSTRVDAFPPRFHEAAAIATEAVLDGLGIERCAIWGHSDGAVIALLMALRRPARCTAVVVEAVHLDRAKPRSRAFFQMMADDPDGFGERVTSRLAADLGPDWRLPIRAGGRAWLDIAATPDDDLYDHRLPELRVPLLAVHGAKDPRTEPGELDRLRRDVPSATVHLVPNGGHSPHSERAAAAETTAVATSFLRRHRADG